jgi:hypothetical protein
LADFFPAYARWSQPNAEPSRITFSSFGESVFKILAVSSRTFEPIALPLAADIKGIDLCE